MFLSILGMSFNWAWGWLKGSPLLNSAIIQLFIRFERHSEEGIFYFTPKTSSSEVQFRD